MGIQFGSDEWIKALKDELNQSAAYADAAKDWEGDFYFVIEPEGALTETVYLYMDLWHGKCRDAFRVQDRAAKNPAFEMSGQYPKWKKVVSGQLDPIQGLMTGQFKLKGNLVQIMKYVQAAQELVKACTRVDTEFAM
ncbi:MAG: SCP2 sterol-binding domain-containing protein [Chloroflexi bacterium]|nr:SCP2 sterol-binding domain-containing protein [Chloroflexota bacterium]